LANCIERDNPANPPPTMATSYPATSGRGSLEAAGCVIFIFPGIILLFENY
jgi:hypothetical protein